jgi:hypothetical protein
MKDSTLRNRMRDYLVVTTLQAHNNDIDAAVAHWTTVTGQTVDAHYTNAVKLGQLLHYYVTAMHPTGLASAAKSARLTVKRVADDYYASARGILGTAY